jgi:hypothetical protein
MTKDHPRKLGVLTELTSVTHAYAESIATPVKDRCVPVIASCPILLSLMWTDPKCCDRDTSCVWRKTHTKVWAEVSQSRACWGGAVESMVPRRVAPFVRGVSRA